MNAVGITVIQGCYTNHGTWAYMLRLLNFRQFVCNVLQFVGCSQSYSNSNKAYFFSLPPSMLRQEVLAKLATLPVTIVYAVSDCRQYSLSAVGFVLVVHCVYLSLIHI